MRLFSGSKSKDSKESDSSLNYVFNSLLVYNWDTGGTGMSIYRRVFDRWELQNVGVEISFINKLFDEEDWKAVFTFKAWRFNAGQKQDLMCTIEEEVEIDKSLNYTSVFRGWGSETLGEIWTKGAYLWEAFIDGVKVDEAKFYVEDHGKGAEYLKTISLKLYEGPDEYIEPDEREYKMSFASERTRYIHAEYKFESLIPDEWLCELVFCFYDDSRSLIGRIPAMELLVKENSENGVFTVSKGWGNEDVNNWKDDNYVIEIEFMEKIVATLPFAVGEDLFTSASEDAARYGLPVDTCEDEDDNLCWDPTIEEFRSEDGVIIKPVVEKEQKLEDALNQLNELVGLKQVKEQINEHISYLEFLKVRKEMGVEEPEEIQLHSVFTGNPGTGKSTVVKLLGEIYYAMGILSKGHVHVVESNDLVSGYVRQSGGTTKEEIEKARGGILFIDEAYMLYRKEVDNDFGVETVATLITEMSDGPGDIAIMMAGYPTKTMEMINSNPGLKSRIKHYFHFEDFTPDELMDIGDFAARKKHVELSKEAKQELEIQLMRKYRDRDETFGNARLVHSLIDDAKMNMGIRVMQTMERDELNEEIISTIEKEDVVECFEEETKNVLNLSIDQELLEVSLRELNDLVGLESIKEEVRDMIKLVKYYREIGKDIRGSFAIHSVFKGNPGTGKTTIARIISSIYKALGVLERGHVVETDSSDLIAGYLGQTAIKTSEKIAEANGGILFIDEAYSLTEGAHPEFGKKAVATLIKEMEDKRGQFGVIVAGYTKPMNDFLKSNPGIQSRFDQTYNFRDFSKEELFVIAELLLAKSDLTLNKEAASHLKNYLAYLHSIRNAYFGNARSVRKIIERTIKNQHLRMAALSESRRSAKMIKEIRLEDVKEFVPAGNADQKRIGFKFQNS